MIDLNLLKFMNKLKNLEFEYLFNDIYRILNY